MNYRLALDTIVATFPMMAASRAHRLAAALHDADNHRHTPAAFLRDPACHKDSVAATCKCGQEMTTEEVIRALPAVVNEMRAGKKIQAIKELRSLTHWGLKESKDAVECRSSW